MVYNPPNADEPGMSPELEVATWWDSLNTQERLVVGERLFPGSTAAPGFPAWDAPWCELSAMTQQMHIHMYYDSGSFRARAH